MLEFMKSNEKNSLRNDGYSCGTRQLTIPPDHVALQLVVVVVVVVVAVVVVVVWGPESRCTAACRLIVHTPCVFNVPTFTARRLHVTTTLEILAAKSGTCWARNVQ
jgi:hypothetical protein